MKHLEKKYKLEAPEGGWGYLICLGMSLSFTQCLGAVQCFGFLFKDFFEEIGGGTTAISIVSSSFFCSLSFAGLLSSSLFRKFGIRKVGLVGALLYVIGSIAQVFVQSGFHLLIAYGLFQGASYGLFIPVCYSLFNQYFVQKRVLMMSLGKTLMGFGLMIYPILVRNLLDWYGFRGTLLVLAAINSHAIFAMLIMHPVEWHLKKVEVVDSELQDFNGNEKNTHCHSEEHHKMIQHSKNSFSETKIYREQSMEHINHLTSSRRTSSIAQKKDKGGKWNALVDFLDLTLFKDLIYVNITLGATFALYSDVAFFTLHPLYLYHLGYSRADTALIIAIGCACDLASRMVLGAIAVFVSIPSRYVYLSGAIFTFFFRFAFLKVTDFTAMAIMTGILGFLKTWVHVPLPLLFAEHLPSERFASGYGLFMFFQGTAMFLISPVAGYIRDSTGDYGITYHFINIFMGLCAVPWIIEICIHKFRVNKRKQGTTSANAS